MIQLVIDFLSGATEIPYLLLWVLFFSTFLLAFVIGFKAYRDRHSIVRGALLAMPLVIIIFLHGVANFLFFPDVPAGWSPAETRLAFYGFTISIILIGSLCAGTAALGALVARISFPVQRSSDDRAV